MYIFLRVWVRVMLLYASKALASKIVKKLLFSHLKSYFIDYTITLDSTLNIQNSIFFPLYLSFFFFFFFFRKGVFLFTISLFFFSFYYFSLSLPPTSNHHPATKLPTQQPPPTLPPITAAPHHNSYHNHKRHRYANHKNLLKNHQINTTQCHHHSHPSKKRGTMNPHQSPQPQ